MKKKEELREIPKKNYLFLLLLAVGVIILTFYINAWIKTYKANEYSKSSLSGKIKEVNINELQEPFYEINETILYVGYSNDEKLYNEEKQLYKLIKKYDLTERVMYLNVYNNENYKEILEKRFGNDIETVEEAPLLIYISDGETKEIVNVKKINTLSIEFEKLVEKYEIEE